MLEYIQSRVKVTFLLILFFAPVFAAAWNKHLDEWFRQNHSYYNVPQADVVKTVNAAGR